MEKSKENMAYLVARGHSPKKVKRTFENVGKMTRTKARVKKQRAINKNTIIFSEEYNPSRPDVNAIINRHEQKELSPTNSFIVANKRAKNLRVSCTCRSLQHKNGSFKSN